MQQVQKTQKSTNTAKDEEMFFLYCNLQEIRMVVGDGFEPSKSATADLQSAPFSHSGIPPLNIMERVTGIEPVLPAWKAGAQPLCHTRVSPKSGTVQKDTTPSHDNRYLP